MPLTTEKLDAIIAAAEACKPGPERWKGYRATPQVQRLIETLDATQILILARMARAVLEAELRAEKYDQADRPTKGDAQYIIGCIKAIAIARGEE